jgi:hypothetical protein
VCAGQGDRQLDLDEGGRGEFLRAGDEGPQVRRSRDRHGVRRAGPGRHGGAQGRHLRAGLPDPHRAGRLPARGHHLRPEHLRRRHGDRGARCYGSPSSRRPAGSRPTLPARWHPGGVSNVSFSFRGNNPVREAIHSVFLYHAMRAGMDMGIVNAGARSATTTSTRSCASASRTWSSTRRSDATERLLEVAERFNGRRAGEKVGGRPEWRELPLRERLTHALVHGHRRASSRRTPRRRAEWSKSAARST